MTVREGEALIRQKGAAGHATGHSPRAALDRRDHCGRRACNRQLIGPLRSTANPAKACCTGMISIELTLI
jgi:hypothetical protein